jgi:NTP pyrophosphatase (non-canonical NTP hydrolase)
MERLDTVMNNIREFVAEREWQPFHDPKNLAMAIASEAGELIAEYRWVSNADADRLTTSEERRARISGEAADVGIALLLFCDRIGLDLFQAIEEKMAVNRRNYPAELSRGHAERPNVDRA